MSDVDLLTTIRRVRRRWRLALVLRGAALFAAAALALIAISALGFASAGLSPATIFAMRLMVGIAAAAVLVIVVVRPMMRRVSDARVALYIEEHEPALQALLISALDVGTTDVGLAGALVDRATAECRRLDFGEHIEHERLRRNTLVLAAAVAMVVVIIAAGPPSLRRATRALLLPVPPADAAVAMTISVKPGSDTIARGADFAINAHLNGFTNDAALVVLRAENGEWRRWPMSEGQKPGAFETVLFDVAVATDYYIESAAVRSPVFHITVADAPYVRSLALDYTYPGYTGLAPRRVENGGDIVAPKGTIVRVIASPSAAADRGRLRIDNSQIIAMQPTAGGALQAPLHVTRDGLYYIELPDIDGRLTSASAQYAITAVADEPPAVRVDKPGRDVKVTAVDEVFMSASAQDDYGVSALDLVFSVNGGPEQTQSLAKPTERSPALAGAHTFFLEELSLKPGDIVSYFARATDNNAIDGPRTATTDIYFIQIRPFSRNYRAAEQNGQPGDGQEDDPGSLSERQRQVIAATFNVVRDRATYTDKGFAEAITTIELSQRRLREQVATLVQRMQQRDVAQMDSAFAEIAQLLPQAGREMAAAEERLQQRAATDALPPEQRALQQLLRAEALYRDVQIQMQQQQGANGSSGMAEDLADMFELERNQLRNQYEAVQRSQQEQQRREVDNALERLRELARRQQQEAERQQQSASGQPQPGAPGAGGGAQRRLADEAEQAARQLERLARENPSPQMSEAARSLREAADAMRKASAERNGNGLAAANAARERLEEARRRLQRSDQQSLEQRIADARARADALRAEQDRIAAEAEQAGATPTPEQQRQSSQQRAMVGAGVGELERELDRIEAGGRGTNANAARAVGAAADAIRESRLRERMRAAEMTAQSRTREFNRAQDEQIARDFGRVTSQLQRAQAAAGAQSREAQASDGADRARALAQGVEGMRDRARAGAQPRQLDSEMRARAGEMQELQRQVEAQGMGGQPMQDAVESLRAATLAASRGNREEVDRLLAQVARGLENLEFYLRTAARTEDQQKLFTSGRGQVPAQYRKAVEEYYRALARKGR